MPISRRSVRPEVDASGYDLVLECGSIVRHVQVKASKVGGRRANVGLNINLRSKPSGCVVWVYFKPASLELGPFFWFGAGPGQPLPSLSGFKAVKHTKGDATGHKAERPNLRVIPKGRFVRVDTMAELVERLFNIGAKRG